MTTYTPPNAFKLISIKAKFHKIKLNVRVNPLKTITNAQLTFKNEYMFLEYLHNSAAVADII